MNATQQLLDIAKSIIDAINSVPDGVPAGHLYAQLMAFGCTLEQFNQLMDLVCASGKVRKQGDLYLPGDIL